MEEYEPSAEVKQCGEKSKEKSVGGADTMVSSSEGNKQYFIDAEDMAEVTRQTPMMSRLLKNAGFINVQQKANVFDFSFGTQDYEAFR